MSRGRACANLVGMLRLIATVAVVLLVPVAAAPAADPGRWRLAGRSAIPLEYFQGMASDPDRHVFFDGVFAGLFAPMTVCASARAGRPRSRRR